MKHVDAVCFQEVSEAWMKHISDECFDTNWQTHTDTVTNVLTALRTTFISEPKSQIIFCFPESGDRRNRHRYWRRALELTFTCLRTGRIVSLVNLHIIAGSLDNSLRSSVIPGNSLGARERFKITALKHTMIQACERLREQVRLADSSMSGLMIVAGDMNLDTAAVSGCLSEVAGETNQAYAGRSAAGSAEEGSRGVSMGSGCVPEVRVRAVFRVRVRPPASLTTRVPRRRNTHTHTHV